ncbi:MAG: hypothetical protein WDN72_03455 [Alphaproteobacteria bacterium]
MLVWLQFHSAPLQHHADPRRAAGARRHDAAAHRRAAALQRRAEGCSVATFLSIALIVTMPIIWNYFGEAYSDHHSFLAMLWVWALAPHLMRNPSRVAIAISGLLFALMLWISTRGDDADRRGLPLSRPRLAARGSRWAAACRSSPPPSPPARGSRCSSSAPSASGWRWSTTPSPSCRPTR